MATTVIDTGKRVFANLKSILFTPWDTDTKPGTATYDLVSIVGDTTSVEQADNTINAIGHEFSSTPLYENVTLGAKTFTCECIDFQNKVLKNLMGWTVEGTDDTGDAFAPIAYKELYCKIDLQFNSTEDVICLPKVKLNSKAILNTMKTGASRGIIAGTCYAAYVKAGEKEHETDEAIISKTNAESYSVSGSATIGA